MSDTPEQALQQEWHTLQHNHEQYERHALLIKLAAVALVVAHMAFAPNAWSAAALLLVLWLQEGILRTSQSRLGDRILRIEHGLRDTAPLPACQLHTDWLASRPGTVGLVAEYVKNALRPTVAFPYAPLLLLLMLAR